ncbi:uncharacterized protein LOC124257622 [Haliotis rubra]|uniref:uncharacterized protein LOC124257622 n=1 Tax=Haliotis rubra TaxID=36100 RepID=UPI001EE53CC2|nr:uncharacterized protein LOC124257622 [Haliotis rubra]
MMCFIPSRLAHVVPVFCTLLAIIMSGTGDGGITNDGMWTRNTVMDDLRSTSDVLWVHEACMSDIACVVMCLSSVVCKSVFYNPNNHQCQGHSVIVTVSDTTAEVGNIFFAKIIPPAPPTTTTTPTPYLHYADTVNNMAYDIYTSGPMGWLDAEAECLRRSKRLIRLETSAKRTALRTKLGTINATRDQNVWVAGYRCCNADLPTWDSAKLYPSDYNIYNHFMYPLPWKIVTTVNSSDTIDLLTVDLSIDDKRLFVCEDLTGTD